MREMHTATPRLRRVVELVWRRALDGATRGVAAYAGEALANKAKPAQVSSTITTVRKASGVIRP